VLCACGRCLSPEQRLQKPRPAQLAVGDGVTSLLIAPFIAALFIFVLGIGLYTPALLGDGRRKLQITPERRPQAFSREQVGDSLDLSLLPQSDFGGAAIRAAVEGAGMGKRALDICAALALLVFFAPLLILTAIAIKLDSPGPILYRQRRIGLGGDAFHIFKFRSMFTDAEKNGAQWAAANDNRITRIGRIIRKTRIDEIPQALNVLRGEMSFVGPRPERPEFVGLLEKEIPNYHLRHVVKPGITGWAQVKYCYTASVEDARIKLRYDLHYIKHFSLWRDILIMAMTVRVALFGLGSR
jgi:lipopolysaccharide/colanic/teichoic acid biosynthesis glycosyltransferase